MKKSLETKVAATILQEPIKIEIGGKIFNVAPITTATLIEVSKLISLLPTIKLDEKNFIPETLLIAKDCGIMGQVAATMILGVSKQTYTSTNKESCLKRLKIGRKKNMFEELGKELLLTLSPKELEELIVDLLKGMEIQPFFSIITSLLEVNLLKATR